MQFHFRAEWEAADIWLCTPTSLSPLQKARVFHQKPSYRTSPDMAQNGGGALELVGLRKYVLFPSDMQPSSHLAKEN